jgi:hypothetical protein
MRNSYLLIAVFSTAFVLHGCSKKSHPGRTPQRIADSTSLAERTNDSLLAKKAAEKKKEKAIIPKVITVNDSVAHKSVDGRLYYDVMGHRYWRNYQDGKYYLFNKSMYNNDAFKAPD